MGKFDGRVAIITGGGKGGGIGYGLSTAFAKEGCNLVITGRNTKKLDDAKEELERLYGVKVLACQADGGVEEQVAAVVKQAADTLGRIDFLINNAQNSASGVPLAEHTKEQFDQAIYSGLYAAFYHVLGAVHTEHILSAACGTEDELSVRGVQYHAFFFFSSLGKHRSRLRVLYGPPSAGPGACLQPQHQHQAQRCCQHRYTSFLHCSQTHICNPSCQTSTVRGILYQCMQKRHMISRRRSIADIVFPL